MKLYVYDHCPFCTKARMIFGLKSLPLMTLFYTGSFAGEGEILR